MDAYLACVSDGCMGITVYRDGCKPMQVLTHGAKIGRSNSRNSKEKTMKGRPDMLLGRTIKIESPHGTVYTTVNENGNGEAFEIFVNVGKPDRM